jgi:hypothetical protein
MAGLLRVGRKVGSNSFWRPLSSTGLPHLIPYFQDREPEFRRCVAIGLGNYPEHAAISLPALQAAAASETDEEVRETVRESIERLTTR